MTAASTRQAPLPITHAPASRRNARLYLAGLTASQLGDAAMALAAAVWIKTITGSTSAAALVAVAIYVPVALAPLAGVLVDRIRRRRLLVGGNATMAVLILALLAVDGPGTVWLLYAVMVCYGVAAVVLDPAERAVLTRLTDDADRARLNGIATALQQAGKLVAPLLGVGLFARFGGHPVAVLDAASFAIAALCAAALRIDDTVPEREPARWWAELTGGVRALAGHAVLVRVVAVAAVAMALAGICWASAYALADSLGRPPTAVGWLAGAMGAGSIIGGLLAGRIATRVSEARLAELGALAFAAGLALGCLPSLPLAGLGWFVRGLGLPWLTVAVFTLAQRSVPDAMQGRTSAAIGFALFATQPLAYLAGAGLFAVLDYRVVLGGAAVVSLASAALVRTGAKAT